MIWLTMPTALLHAYVEMLPAIEAEDTLREAFAVSVGFSGDKQSVAALQKQAGFQPAKKITGREFAAAMGIPVRVHKKEPEHA